MKKKEVITEWTSAKHTAGKANKQREVISKKIDNLLICKEGENEERNPSAVATFSVLFILTDKPWSTQSMKIQLRCPNYVPYYIWVLGADTILDYWIAGDVLEMSVETQINSLQSKPEKEENIRNIQYMESKKDFKLGLIGIDNTSHVRDIVDLRASLFYETII